MSFSYFLYYDQAFKYQSIEDIIQLIRKNVRCREETTGHSALLKWQWGFDLSQPSEKASDQTVTLSDVNVSCSVLEANMLNGESE